MNSSFTLCSLFPNVNYDAKNTYKTDVFLDSMLASFQTNRFTSKNMHRVSSDNLFTHINMNKRNIAGKRKDGCKINIISSSYPSYFNFTWEASHTVCFFVDQCSHISHCYLCFPSPVAGRLKLVSLEWRLFMPLGIPLFRIQSRQAERSWLHRKRCWSLPTKTLE